MALEVDSLCSKSLEGDTSVLLRLEGNVGNKSVPLVLSTSGILVSLPLHDDTNSVRDVTNTLAPKVLVEADSNSDILGTHLLLSESLDLSDGTRSSLLKSTVPIRHCNTCTRCWCAVWEKKRR